jgi:hypothetical protein
VLAATLFAEMGYRQVWVRLSAGLDPTTVAIPAPTTLIEQIVLTHMLIRCNGARVAAGQTVVRPVGGYRLITYEPVTCR